MKKTISLALVALMVSAMSTTAFAADIKQDATLPAHQGTTVTYTVNPTYTVTIPETITLIEQKDKSYAGTGDISTSAVRLKMNETLDVKISSDFIMETIQGAEQEYTVTKDKETTALTNNTTIAEFGTSEKAQNVTLNYFSENPKYAGEYKDIVTFTISINNISKGE